MREGLRKKSLYTFVGNKSRFPGAPLPHEEPDTTGPWFWLNVDDGNVFFINESDKVIEDLKSSTSGWITADEGVMHVGSKKCLYHYENVLPGEAVKIDEYDGYYDLDFVLQISILIKLTQFGLLRIDTPPEKGLRRNQIALLLPDGKPAKDIKLQWSQD